MIDEIRALYLSLQKVPCTGCQYCMPCPYGVDIPRCFELYNSKYLLNQRVRTFYWMQLGGINGNASYASLCRHCGKCMMHCPQKIQIPFELEKVAKDMEGPLFKPTMWLGKRVMKGVHAILRRF
jgi:predicted aldo/keto reductase-like oxidoreductase